MFERFKAFLRGAPPPIAEKIEHPILGTLTWSSDDEAWVSDAAHAGLGFEFQISGTPEPDHRLIAHAVDIFNHKDDFASRVYQYVRSQIDALPGLRSYRAEIEGLRIDRVCLFWPHRPEDGMIALSGGWDYRAWRCDLIGRKPIGLGFDS